MPKRTMASPCLAAIMLARALDPADLSDNGLAFGGQLELAYALAVSCPGP